MIIQINSSTDNFSHILFFKYLGSPIEGGQIHGCLSSVKPRCTCPQMKGKKMEKKSIGWIMKRPKDDFVVEKVDIHCDSVLSTKIVIYLNHDALVISGGI
ncbi:hypothetical protein Fmac_008516 [Flemingia macrophylla]|uniref:Uncharacterized protein n=1 Tax=Flemingia macrophylla TaxID=520843 RepID=A0ABD1MY58_9FABA